MGGHKYIPQGGMGSTLKERRRIARDSRLHLTETPEERRERLRRLWVEADRSKLQADEDGASGDEGADRG